MDNDVRNRRPSDLRMGWVVGHREGGRLLCQGWRAYRWANPEADVWIPLEHATLDTGQPGSVVSYPDETLARHVAAEVGGLVLEAVADFEAGDAKLRVPAPV